MNRKTASVLLIALVCGLGAMVVSSRMLAGAPAPAAPEMQTVLVAARDVNFEEFLKPDMVKVESVPKATAPAGSFKDFAEVADRWAAIKILEGEPIVDKKLAAKGTPAGLVARIPKGKRAFAINVNEQTGVSGLILPDHRVDIFQVKPARPGQPGGGPGAEPVLQDLLILACGTNTQSPTDRSIQARTVTVAVTTEEAAILTAAQSRGALTLALRSLNDHELTPVAEEPAIPQVSMAPPPAAPPTPEPKAEPTAAEPQPRHVTIYRGGKPPERIRVDQAAGEEDNPGDGFPSGKALSTARPADATAPKASEGHP